MHLFTPMRIREVTLRNRVAVSPMCQYSSVDGFSNDWHLVHLGARAIGGAGLVIAEATSVTPDGRISPQDLGIWNDAHVPGLARITKFIREQGAVAGIQLAHAGRKASTRRPWEGSGVVPEAEGGWARVFSASPVPFSDRALVPEALDRVGIERVIDAFVQGARRSLEAGFQVIELHAAHGYLLHQFLSPLSNFRTDEYGGAFENRIRIVLEAVRAIRQVWPDELPLFLRVSGTDWAEGGWKTDDTVRLAKAVHPLGVDVVDCSSGGVVPGAEIPVGSGYQVPFSRAVRSAGVPSAAVGLITAPAQADAIIRNGDADIVMMARELLRDPHWPLHAARELGYEITWPVQYERAKD
jgi:2,4-dienoyl-CoA reductase-like NADH-dependent reductase (Old Yellow Enzyme family)